MREKNSNTHKRSLYMFIAQKSASLIKERERPKDTGTFPSSMEYSTRKWPSSDTTIFYKSISVIIFRITEPSQQKNPQHSIKIQNISLSLSTKSERHTQLAVSCTFFFPLPSNDGDKSTVAPLCNNNGTFNKWNTFYHTVKCCKLKEQWYPMKSTHR